MKNVHTPFWIFIISLLFFFYISLLVQYGMFFDGAIYGTLAKNLSQNIGTFYEPRISKFFFSSFHEHPTLAIYLESLLFRLFGDGFYIERVYSLGTLSVTLFFMYKIWNMFLVGKEKSYSWVPIAIFLSFPLVSWSYTQNMLEGTLGMFTLISLYTMLTALQCNRKIKSYIWILLTSLLITAAVLSKGPIGLFPIIIMPLYYITIKNVSFQKSLLLFVVMMISLLVIWVVLLQDDALLQSIMHYLNQQLYPSLNGERSSVENRYTLLWDLFLQLFPFVLFFGFFIIVLHKKIDTTIKKDLRKKTSLFFFLIALSASLPIMISKKQYGFYLVPSLPYFSLSFSLLFLPYIIHLVEKIQRVKLLLWIAIFVFSFSIFYTITKVGQYSRDEILLEDLKKIASVVPSGSIVGIEPQLGKDIKLHTYSMRYYNIELDVKNKYEYHLKYKNHIRNENTINNYKYIEIELKKYSLYKFY